VQWPVLNFMKGKYVMREFFKSIKTRDVLILCISFVVLLIVDQYTKFLTVKYLEHGESKEFIKGFLRFTYVRNKGASFGMLQGQRLYFIIITSILLPIMVFLYLKISVIMNICKEKIKSWHFIIVNISLMLLIIGSVGNFIDRIRLAYVIDFLDVQFIDFPVFNMADCYITVGTIGLLIMLLIMNESEIDYILKSRKKWDNI